MNAIILAAGRGSRMKQMTETKPKCLLRLGEKALLEWQTEALYSAGVSSITIIRGYRKESLEGLPYQFFDNLRWAETNMVHSLSCAAPLLRQNTCLISYSDIVYHSSIIAALKKAHGDIVLTYDEQWESLWKERFENPLEDAETFECLGKQLKTIGEKASTFSQIQGQYMGLIKITPKGWRLIENYLCSLSPELNDRLDMTSLFKRLLKAGISISTVPIQGKWCEVDREADLELYEKRLHTHNWAHDWR